MQISLVTLVVSLPPTISKHTQVLFQSDQNLIMHDIKPISSESVFELFIFVVCYHHNHGFHKQGKKRAQIIA